MPNVWERGTYEEEDVDADDDDVYMFINEFFKEPLQIICISRVWLMLQYLMRRNARLNFHLAICPFINNVGNERNGWKWWTILMFMCF